MNDFLPFLGKKRIEVVFFDGFRIYFLKCQTQKKSKYPHHIITAILTDPFTNKQFMKDDFLLLRPTLIHLIRALGMCPSTTEKQINDHNCHKHKTYNTSCDSNHK